ncbi:hypothetical protein KAU19_00440 [Candidatus Parcubacteria bacterium]|nr:hypothetical protein [Candidatus Parcubacteria bacterium]
MYEKEYTDGNIIRGVSKPEEKFLGVLIILKEYNINPCAIAGLMSMKAGSEIFRVSYNDLGYFSLVLKHSNDFYFNQLMELIAICLEI